MKRLDLNTLHINSFLVNAFAKCNRSAGGTLLDLGCGTQPYRALYEMQFDRVYEADFLARSRLDIQLDATQLPFANESFDTVLFSEVLEHIPSPELAIAEIARVLKPGGTLFLTWPFAYSMHEIPNDYSRPTEFGVAAWLQRSGLELVQLKRRADSVGLIVTLVCQFMLNVTEALTRIPILGFLLMPISLLAMLANNFLIGAVFFIFKNVRWQNPDGVGENLRGIGHLGLWPLGYCAIARKMGAL